MSPSHFTSACAAGGDWKSIADQCLQVLEAGPAPATLGLLYVTEPLVPQLGVLHDYLRRITGVNDWIGTAASGICTTGRELYDGPAAALMLATLPDDCLRLIPCGIAELTGMLTQHQHWISEHAAHFAIVHGDPRDNRVPQIIESLSHHLDPGFLVGGLSSAEAGHYPTQIAGKLCEQGISGVLLSAEVPVVSGLTQGCSPLAGKHVITRCERNVLIELDGRPALDVFREDIGEVLSRDLTRVAGYIFAGLPVPGSDTGDYLVRNLVGIDPGEKLIAIGEIIEQDDSIMFCRRDGDTAREDMQRMLGDLRKRAGDGIKGGVYYTCLGRGRHQFGEDSEELRMIRDQLGDFPLVGFFANGEISHNRLYGYTGVLTLFV